MKTDFDLTPEKAGDAINISGHYPISDEIRQQL
jgi:hypothetical protein